MFLLSIRCRPVKSDISATLESRKRSGVEVVFEGTAPVGDKPADFEGSGDELYPHILGGITPRAVLAVHKVIRNDSGDFIAIEGL